MLFPFLALLYRHQNKRTSNPTLWLCVKHKLVEVLYFLILRIPPCTKKYFSTFYLLKNIEYSYYKEYYVAIGKKNDNSQTLGRKCIEKE
ncbi:hypothetical protein COE04_01285 [Bacillus cereus]|nr:hypothetical protein COE04_01285 [Bacillus cereus]